MCDLYFSVVSVLLSMVPSVSKMLCRLSKAWYMRASETHGKSAPSGPSGAFGTAPFRNQRIGEFADQMPFFDTRMTSRSYLQKLLIVHWAEYWAYAYLFYILIMHTLVLPQFGRRCLVALD